VFQSHTGRRVVLATNVAETSLTVPGIKYVVDPGTARISRYSHRTKVQRLPIEPISQASANQRKGRCGRTSDGICIRLYSEEDFLARPEYTDPEVLRTNLASVILQMTAIELGDIAAFPFLDPPDRRNIADGVALLNELGALSDGRLTPMGRRLAQLPVDPRLARMIIDADRNGCAREVMVIAAALSIQDPRERPVDKQQAADEKHVRFRDKESDFLTYLNLWNYLHEQQQDRSSSGFRRMCRTEFLNYLRVREWQDLFSQLRQIARQVGITLNTGPPAEPEHIHQSVLAGLLSHIGLRDSAKNDYLGARGARFAVFPGSALFSKPPQWIMAAELVETARLWARVVAKIEPDWAEKLAGHLVKRTYSEPHWEKKQGAVMAYEKVTLYGVPLVAARKINYGRVDPELSRELFIRHALVEGDWDTHHAFFAENRALLDEIEELEHRSRRRDIRVDDETLFAFYDQRIGRDVVSARHFDTWWKKTRRSQPDLLNFEKSMLVNESANVVSARDYPDVWPHDGVPLRLTYQFEPGADADGVTVHIPLAVLNRIRDAGFDWQVPGLRQELVTALLRSLPKALRRNFVPIPDFAADAVAHMAPGEGSLLDSLERYLRRTTGVLVTRDAWDLTKVPDHLRMTYRVEDADGAISNEPAAAAPAVPNGPAAAAPAVPNEPAAAAPAVRNEPAAAAPVVLAEGKDLAALQQRLTPKLRETLAEAAAGIERSGIKTWDFGTLPQRVQQSRAGYPVTAYPALVDTGDSVAIRVFDTEAAQQAAHVAGTRRLLLLNLPSPGKFVQGRLSNQAKLALSRGPHRSALDLVDDCAGCAVDGLVARNGGPAWDEPSFARLREAVRGGLVDAVLAVLDSVQRVLASAYAISQRLSSTANPALVPAYADIRAQLGRLVYRGFVTDTGAGYLPELPRYLQAIERRLDKLPENPQRDRDRMRQIEEVEAAYREVAADAPADPAVQGELRRIRWMLEELRVNLFAQALGTPYSVSDKRIYRALDDLT
jgi:ATP-dependent helicase HrpA